MDLKMRFAGSALGSIWLFLYPLFMLSAYAMVYIFIFRIRPQGVATASEYVIYIYSGLIPFLGFSESLAAGVPSITSNAELIKNTLFPVDLIPLRAVLGSLLRMGVSLLLLLFAAFFIKGLSGWVLLLILIVPLQFMFCSGLVWILASLNVFFKDLQHIVSIITMLLLLSSPIAYTVDMAKGTLGYIVKLNPIYYILACYQAIITFDTHPNMKTFSIYAIMSIGLFIFGYTFLKKMKQLFPSNV